MAQKRKSKAASKTALQSTSDQRLLDALRDNPGVRRPGKPTRCRLRCDNWKKVAEVHAEAYIEIAEGADTA